MIAFGKTDEFSEKFQTACVHNVVLPSAGVPAKLPEDELLQQLHPVCFHRGFRPVPETHLPELHRQRHGRHLNLERPITTITTAKTGFLLLEITAFLEVYFFSFVLACGIRKER